MGCPIVFRGPNGAASRVGAQHSQCFASWYAHIPGLKVVAPYSAADAKGLLKSAIRDPNPVIFLENELIYGSSFDVPDDEDHVVPIGKAAVVREGSDVTITAFSICVRHALEAADALAQIGIEAEVIDLRTIKPLDWQTVMDSVAKTGRILALDSGFTAGSVAGEIVARVAMEKFIYLKTAPARLAMPDVPEPTSPALTKGFYLRAADVAVKVMEMMGTDAGQVRKDLPEPIPHDVPGEWFKGPF